MSSTKKKTKRAGSGKTFSQAERRERGAKCVYSFTLSSAANDAIDAMAEQLELSRSETIERAVFALYESMPRDAESELDPRWRQMLNDMADVYSRMWRAAERKGA